MINIYQIAKANTGEVKQFSCKELLFLIIECPPDFIKGHEYSEHNCFIYGIKGQHLLSSYEKSWMFEQGQTIFIKKGGLGVERVGKDVFCILMFFVPDSYLRSFIAEKFHIIYGRVNGEAPRDMLYRIETNDVLRSFYESVLSYFNDNQPPAEDLIDLKFKELLLNIITNPSNTHFTNFLYKFYMDQVYDLEEVMDRNYLYDFKMEDYARLSHRSLASFKRDFQKIYGTTPGRWLIRKRLESAKKLLMMPQKSINDVVFESGFKNNAHFSRAFKACYGYSPMEFRKRPLATTH